jgi:hypothetical protein
MMRFPIDSMRCFCPVHASPGRALPRICGRPGRARGIGASAAAETVTEYVHQVDADAVPGIIGIDSLLRDGECRRISPAGRPPLASKPTAFSR